MKTQKLLIAMMGLGAAMHAQQPPTNNTPILLNGNNSGQYWSRAGNSIIGGTNNIFGTDNTLNSGIFTQTFGVNRMRLNGNSSYAVNGFPAMTRDGFLLLGGNASYSGGTLYGAANGGAFSLLHLNGVNPNNSAQESGFRDWMRYGITSTHNQDLMFIGQRATAVPDVTDATIAWADNAGTGPGPDNMVFTFLNGADNVTGSDLVGNNKFGREIMRLTALNGYIGMGPRFNNANQPTSALHLHKENDSSAWMQYTNQRLTNIVNVNAPTPLDRKRGLRMGVLGQPTQIQNGNAFIYNQENRHLILSTNHKTPDTVTITRERVRITNLNAPTVLPGGTTYGTYLPPGTTHTATTDDVTRIGISFDPANPVSRPLSLMHLGFNASGTPATSLDGWRPWMDLGTFTNSDFGLSMYSGLKINTSGVDAVVGWGYSPATSTSAGTHMRFIFTQPTTATDTAGKTNGLEVAHFWSDGNNGRMAVGNFQSVNSEPRNTLEIMSSKTSPYFGSGKGSSGLKFRNLTRKDSVITDTNVVSLTKVLSVDTGGNVVLIASSGAGGGVGNLCGSTKNPLKGDYEIPFNKHTYTFSDPDTLQYGLNSVRIGGICGSPIPAKLDVIRNVATIANPTSLNQLGALSVVNHDRLNNGITPGSVSAGGYFLSDGFGPGVTNYGNYGVYGIGTNGRFNYGGYFEAKSGIPTFGLNYGVYAKAPTGNGNCAGYFQGDVTVTGAFTNPSDQMFKTHVDTITNALNVIRQLKPKTFYFDTANAYGMNFSGKKQYGFIAQEVNGILPELVGSVTKPAEYDASGNMTSPAVTYKNLNYNAFFGLLTAAMQKQQAQIEKQDSVINQLAAQLNSCCANSSSRTAANNISVQDVELNNNDAIVLNQNVPNPFAEQTTITYSIPQSTKVAQLLFYNSDGQLIKAVDVTKGKGQLNVFANDLTGGMYSYTLVVDGKIAATKKMVKQ